jgi:hypothetical protein
MTDSNEPKEEAVRLRVSTPRPNPQPLSSTQSREPVRIHLPSQPPTNPVAQTEPPSPVRADAAAMPASMTSHSPGKETARIAVLTDATAKPTMELRETQPLIGLPAVKTPTTRVTVAPAPQPVSRIDEIPMPLCWALFAASTATLILQIWNYLS